ncbi:MAG: hypothetical protein KDA32_13995, partial [Phycisphaerales bacterium]|nr:hypothetical protein [Phycisphaerales bacterium]
LMTAPAAFGSGDEMCEHRNGMGQSDDDRASPGKKGSLLILPKVELRWDAAGNLTQDTFITLSNDGTSTKGVKIYYMRGDTCEIVDMGLRLTPEEPYYWSLAEPTDSTVSGMRPRRFTDLNGGAVVADGALAGAVIIVATDVNTFEYPQQYNHLAAKATIVNYGATTGAEYDAWAFCRHSSASTSPDRALYMDGCDYDLAPGQLLADLFTDGSEALSGGSFTAQVQQAINLMRLDIDVTNSGTYSSNKGTFVFFTVHKQDETPLTWQQDYCIDCWDWVYISAIEPTVFDAAIVNADRVKARIETFDSHICLDRYEYTTEAPLIGVQTKLISFDTGAMAYAISEMTGQLLASGGQNGNQGVIKIRNQQGGSTLPGGELNNGAGAPNIKGKRVSFR